LWGRNILEKVACELWRAQVGIMVAYQLLPIRMSISLSPRDKNTNKQKEDVEEELDAISKTVSIVRHSDGLY
jgi:hypothetical protein